MGKVTYQQEDGEEPRREKVFRFSSGLFHYFLSSYIKK